MKPLFRLVKLIFSLPFLLLILVTLLVLNSNILKRQEKVPNEDSKQEEEQKDDNEGKEVEPATLIYEEDPAYSGAKFFQKFEYIADQWAYIAYPLEIDPANPPTLIVYSHGSNTNIVNSAEDAFMKDMIMYGELFTNAGYAFGASNQHGANYGSEESIRDMVNLIDWVSERYKIDEKVNLVGFSMGGLPTLYYAFQYPETVNKIALLAPVTCSCGKDKYDAVKEIPIKIWHGDKDVNVGWIASKSFVDRGKTYGKEIDLITIQNGTHWDVDTEMKNEILDFYNE
jgi:dipeptidyl aminopeptidase/acylaminoacyl peptidase